MRNEAIVVRAAWNIVACAAMSAAVTGCKDSRDGAPGAVAPTSLPTISVPPDVDGLRIKAPGSDELILTKTAGTWQVTAPSPGDADQSKVQSLVDNLGGLKVIETVSSKPDDDQKMLYQLDADHAVRVVVTKGGATTLDASFGKSSARGEMAQIAPSPAIYGLSGYSAYLYGGADRFRAPVANAGTGDAGSTPLCPDLDALLKPLMGDAKSLGAIMPTLGAKTKGDSSFDALKVVYKEMQQQTSASAVDVRAQLAALQSHGSTPEEAPILSDLTGAYDVTATGFERYSGAFRMGRISEALVVQKALLDYPATMTRLDKDLRGRCRKIPSDGGAVAAAPAAKPAATFETTYCPNGLFAEGHHGSCACSKYPSLAAAAGHEGEAPGEPINAPRPTHLSCQVGTFPATKGSACIWSCQ